MNNIVGEHDTDELDNMIENSISNVFKTIYFKQKQKDFNIVNINQYYTKIYNFLINDREHKNGFYLYNLYFYKLEKYYKEVIISNIDKSIDLVNSLLEFYNCNEICIRCFSELILRYLDRCFISNNDVKTIQEKSKDIFYDIIYTKYESQLIDITISNLNNFRNNITSYEYDLISLFKLLSSFGNLENINIQNSIIKSTTLFFKNYKSDLIEKQNYEQYYYQLLYSFKLEDTIFKNSFNQQNYINHIRLIDKIVIEDNIDIFNNKNYIINCIHNNQYENLSVLYKLLKRVTKIDDIILPIFIETFILERNNLEKTSINIQDYINHFLDVNHNYELIVEKCFENNNNIMNHYKKTNLDLSSKDVYIQNKKYNFVKILATYINHCLNKCQNLNSISLEKYFSVAINIQEIDYYLELYSKYLGERLLFHNYDIDKEKEIIYIFKKNFGISSTIRMENMLKDITISKDIFKNKYKILTLSYWGINNTECNIPNSIQKYLKEYDEEYNELFKERQIKWNNDLSTINLVIELDKKYQITCNFIEYSIINLFNTKMTYDFNELKQLLIIKKETLFDYINNLIKIKLLVTNNNLVDESSSLTFNKHFTSKKTKIIIPKIEKSKNESNTQLYENRNENINAVIIRIMKSKKTMSYNSIIIELNNTITIFKPQIKDIKKCIENLIERDYLERNDNDKSILNYIS